VYELQSTLQTLATYTAPSGTPQSLTQLGVAFDQTGHLQFDTTAFSQNSTSAILNFMGSESTSGFLQAATTTLTGLTDPVTGLLPNASKSISGEISDIGTKISADQDLVTTLQQSLTKQMAAADAAISSMEQQVSELNNLFTDMQNNAKNG
jgi:flagellar capping protein FliD